MRGLKNIFEKMNGKVFVAVAVALASILSLSSCHKHHTPEQQPSLQISVYIPQPLATKAEEGDIKAAEAEKKINELVVWLYRNADAQTAPSFYCLHLTDLAKYNLESGQEARFTVLLNTNELKQIASQKPNLDLYAVANPTAAGLTLPSTEDDLKAMTRAQLLQMSMSGATFGATYSGCPYTEVPAEGLPYSGVAANVPITGSFPVLVVSKVTLNRCVSKFRLVVCRMDVEDSEFEITNVTIGGNQFSDNEFIFNDSSNPYKIGTTYESNPLTVVSSVTASSIAINDTPGDLLFRSVNHESETADQYWSRLDVAKEAGKLTDVKTFYVRETDKQLTGTITYRTSSSGPERTKTFEMDQTPNLSGDFARNHVWVVYAYFVGGRLVLMPTVLPWTAGNDRLAYSTQGHTDVSVVRWLRYTPDGNYNNWDETWVAVSYGFQGDGITPAYSTRINFTTTNAYPLKLQLDNDFFQFIIVDETHPNPTVWPTQDYNLTAGSHTFGMWVVPKTNATPSSEEQSKVSVTLICIPTGQAPYLIPISHNFPGDSDHIPIRFRRVSPADYEANKTREYDASNPGQYWLEPPLNI